MKIDANSLSGPQVQSELSPKQTTAAIKDSTLSEAEDRTTFNSGGSSVEILTKQALQSPEVREGKVEAIRQSVSSGQYQIDPSKIADAMIASQDE
jgi:negative regulator of flagellin synthesis FlgM